MRKIAESDIKKGAGSSHVMAVQNKPKFKMKGNSWKKKKGKAKDEISKPNAPAPKAGPPANAECFHCHGKGHLLFMLQAFSLLILILILGYLIPDQLLIFAIRCRE